MANAPTTIADMFAAEEKVTVKYSEFYRIIENACSQAAALMYIKNAVMAGVPNEDIQSMLDGQKHWDDLDISNRVQLRKPIDGTLEETEDDNGES